MNLRSRPAQRHRRLAFLVAATAVIVGLGGAALATTVTSRAGNTIQGCYNSGTGALSILTPKHKSCGKGEKAISWGKVGPQGLPGPATKAYFTGGLYADTLGTAKTVAKLALPAGSFSYSVSVEVVNNTASSDTVTCTLTDGGGSQVQAAESTVPASASQAIALDGASTAKAGSATVGCQDTANAAAASVNGASFTATSAASVPTQGPVLHKGSLTGSAVGTGDTISGTYNFSLCTTPVTTTTTVSTNPQAPGTATLSMTNLTFSGCSIASFGATITAQGLPYPLTVSDTGGDAVTLGNASHPVTFKVVVPAVATCTYSANTVTGHWDNSVNGIVVPSQALSGGGTGPCPGSIPFTGTIASITDGGQLIFVS
jgi:hypothetical protein